MNSDKVQDNQKAKEESFDQDSIWASGFESSRGASAAPPPLQLTANPLQRLDANTPKDTGGLSPEQLAMIESFGLSGLVSQLSESEQNDLVAFLADFETNSVPMQFGEGKTERTLQSNGHSLRIA
jgi:hypothetical protein